MLSTQIKIIKLSTLIPHICEERRFIP